MSEIRKFFMWLLFNEKCTCDMHTNRDEAARCYICSPHFRLISEIRRRVERALEYEESMINRYKVRKIK